MKFCKLKQIEAISTRNPCCRKETARCCSCSFQFKVRQRQSLCTFKSSQASTQNRIECKMAIQSHAFGVRGRQ